MNTFELEGWQKHSKHDQSEPFGLISFHVGEQAHLKLERLEESLQEKGQHETYVDSMYDISVDSTEDITDVDEWKVRLFLSRDDQRGMFHLVGHRSKDGSIVYSNSVMVDQLG
jgi:hypothetical protein